MQQPDSSSVLDPRALAPLAVVDRAGLLESRHEGILVVVGEEGEWAVGDPGQPVFVRSAVKPFQALPHLERGMAAALEMEAEHLAMLSASHDGTEDHVRAVRGILDRAGIDPALLGCGAHPPFAAEARRAMLRTGGRPTRLHNNCSGKHAGFLWLAQQLGQEPLESYLEPMGAAMGAVRTAVQEMLDCDAEGFDAAIDGCGAPTFRAPLRALAAAFRKLVNPEGLADVRRAACQSLLEAVTEAPFHLAGEKRLCTALIRSAPGAIYPKNGAEGVYACGIRVGGRSYGLAVKCADGNERGYFPAVIDVLQRLGLWDSLPEDLERFAVPVLMNTQKLAVGRVHSALPPGPLFS